MKTGKERKKRRAEKRKDPMGYLLGSYFKKVMPLDTPIFNWLLGHKSKNEKRKILRGYKMSRKLEGDTVTWREISDASSASSD